MELSMLMRALALAIEHIICGPQNIKSALLS